MLFAESNVFARYRAINAFVVSSAARVVYVRRFLQYFTSQSAGLARSLFVTPDNTSHQGAGIDVNFQQDLITATLPQQNCEAPGYKRATAYNL